MARDNTVATLEERTKTALTKQSIVHIPTISEGKVLEILRPFGTIQTELACGIYNIDFVIGGSIAVECFGGNWHATGRAAARQGKRIEYLLNTGFDVVVVWVHESKWHRIGWPAALEHVIMDLQFPGRGPSASRQYWMIRSNGEIWQSGKRENADFAFVAPANRRRNSKGRYERAG